MGAHSRKLAFRPQSGYSGQTVVAPHSVGTDPPPGISDRDDFVSLSAVPVAVHGAAGDGRAQGEVSQVRASDCDSQSGARPLAAWDGTARGEVFIGSGCCSTSLATQESASCVATGGPPGCCKTDRAAAACEFAAPCAAGGETSFAGSADRRCAGDQRAAAGRPGDSRGKGGAGRARGSAGDIAGW